MKNVVSRRIPLRRNPYETLGFFVGDFSPGIFPHASGREEG
jgi:hypothetical protein